MKKIILGAICILCLQGVDCMQGARIQRQLQGTVQIQNLKQISDDVLYDIRHLIVLHDYCNSLPSNTPNKNEWLGILNHDGKNFIQFMQNVDSNKRGVKNDNIGNFDSESVATNQYVFPVREYNSEIHVNLTRYMYLARKAIEKDYLESGTIDAICVQTTQIHRDLVRIANEMYELLQDMLFEDISEKQESKNLMNYLNQNGLVIGKVKIIKSQYNGRPTNRSFKVLSTEAQNLEVMKNIPPNVYWQMTETDSLWCDYLNTVNLSSSDMEIFEFYSRLPQKEYEKKEGNVSTVKDTSKLMVINHEGGHASCEVFNTIWSLIRKPGDEDSTFSFGGFIYVNVMKNEVEKALKRKKPRNNFSVNVDKVCCSNLASVNLRLKNVLARQLLTNPADILQLIGGNVLGDTLFIYQNNDIVFSVDRNLAIRTDHYNGKIPKLQYMQAKEVETLLRDEPQNCLNYDIARADYEFLSLLIRLYGRDPIAYRQQMGF